MPPLRSRTQERRGRLPRLVKSKTNERYEDPTLSPNAGDKGGAPSDWKLTRLQADLAAKHAREAEDAGAEQDQGSGFGRGGLKVELAADSETDERLRAQQRARCRILL